VDPPTSARSSAPISPTIRRAGCSTCCGTSSGTYFFEFAGGGFTRPLYERYDAISDGLETLGARLDYFHEWIYEEFFPIYCHLERPPSGGDITLQIDQVQTNTVFRMPITSSSSSRLGHDDRRGLGREPDRRAPERGPTDIKLDKAQGGWILKVIQEAIVDPTFDRGILVVNGVDWSNYGTEIRTAYEDSVFWGSHEITFWDLFAPPSGGYPANLPVPLGTNKAVPADTLKQFSAVVWVGNNFNGDLEKWISAPLLDYMNAGGNVLLLTRMGQDFLYSSLADYMGITWAGDKWSTLANYESSILPREPDLHRAQSYNALFDTASRGETEPSARTHERSLERAQRLVAAGFRPDGAQMVFLSGRPYRMNHTTPRANVETILRPFHEPYNPIGQGGAGLTTPSRRTAEPVQPQRRSAHPPDGRARSMSFSSPAAWRARRR
jgi:hypothetical protein